MGNYDSTEVDVTFKHHTEDAVLIEDDVWIPKSQIEERYEIDWDNLAKNEEITITIPEWLAQLKDLI